MKLERPAIVHLVESFTVLFKNRGDEVKSPPDAPLCGAAYNPLTFADRTTVVQAATCAECLKLRKPGARK